MRKLIKLNSFWIRIIALITMTIDHVGVFLDFSKFIILRVIGRFSFPLFAFLTVEGALKTRNKKNYILRILGLFLFIGTILAFFSFGSDALKDIAFTSGNIFLDLLLIVITITILESDNKKIKPLAIIPILYSIFSYTVIRLESCGCDGLYYWFFPSIRMQYGFYGILLALGFYFSKKISPILINKYVPAYGEDKEYNQIITNILSAIVVLFSTLILWAVNFAFGPKYSSLLDGVQTYAIISGVFILLYNGAKGYSAKWFKVAYYLYYPVHIGIISLIFMI